MSQATIYHNPRCSTSRNALHLLEEAGLKPVIVEYLKNPPSRSTLEGLIQQSGLTVREAIRTKESIYAELGLDDLSLSDDHLLDAMLEHPVLINRPFVRTPKGTRLCRPYEVAKEIL